MPAACSARLALPVLASLMLSACTTLASAKPDLQTSQMASSLESRARDFFAGLAAAPAPDCDFDHNAPTYAELAGLAEQLQAHLAANTASAALRRAADALSRAVVSARLSHERASAIATDPAGPCMTGDAIALNADAIARASRAIADSQLAPEGH